MGQKRKRATRTPTENSSDIEMADRARPATSSSSAAIPGGGGAGGGGGGGGAPIMSRVRPGASAATAVAGAMSTTSSLANALHNHPSYSSPPPQLEQLPSSHPHLQPHQQQLYPLQQPPELHPQQLQQLHLQDPQQHSSPLPSGMGTTSIPNVASVRRNLFQSQLTRRPPPTSSASFPTLAASGSSSADMALLDHHASSLSHASVMGGSGPLGSDIPGSGVVGMLGLGGNRERKEESAEIVVRDERGEIASLGEVPELEVDDEVVNGVEERMEHERERQRLVDAVKNHQIHQNAVPEQPEELLEAVRASLRAKVAALADDNWMFEPEDQRQMP